ncbi:MAG: hypothetical protein AAF748_13960 [Pseudomonadota bacterium]
MTLRTALVIASLATAAEADHHSLQIDDCGERAVANAHAAYLVEPWEKNTRYQPEHNLRFIVLGNGEGAPPAYYLMLLANPPASPSDPGPRTCRIVTIEGATGFAEIEMAAATFEDELRRGRVLTVFTVPVDITSASGSTRRQALSVRYLHENGNTTASLDDL